MSTRRIAISLAVACLTTVVTAVALAALAGYLDLALWLLIAVLVLAAVVRLATRTTAAFSARSVTFDLAFIFFLVAGLLLVIPYADLPSPV